MKHQPLAQEAAPEALGAAPIAQFYIPAAASLQERRPRTLKHGDAFAVFDHNGDVISGAGSPEGLYHRDTRHLSHLSLSVCGGRPMLLSSTLRDDNATLTCDLTNPDVYEHGRLVLGHDLVHLRRSKFVWNAICFERLAIRNFDDRRRRQTRLRFDPAPTQLDADRAVFELDLDPHARGAVFIEVRCDADEPTRPPRELFFSALRDARRALRPP